ASQVRRLAVASLLLAALCALPAKYVVVRAETVAQQPASPAPGAGTQDSAKGWQFEDEEEDTPGWRQIVGSQALDLTGFAAFTVLALVSFFRKSVNLKYV